MEGYMHLAVFAIFTFSAICHGVDGLNSTEGEAVSNNTSIVKPNATLKLPQYDACNFFNPCLNQGRCTSEDTTSRSCVCAPGYKGSRCQFVDFCHGEPCGEHGECVSQNLGYICNCRGDYAGKQCDVENPCLETTCFNGGICQVDSTTAKCVCPDSYSGRHCEIQCRPTTYCSYTGIECIVRSNLRITCQCNSQVQRGIVTCVMEDDLVNECRTLRNPCNGGTCVDLQKGFKCSCYSGRSGPRCEIRNPCYGSPCNRGTCVGLSNTEYRCNCNTGYEGKNCQHRTRDTSSPGPPCKVYCTTTGMRVTCQPSKLPAVVRSAPLYARIAEPSYNCTCTFPPERERYRNYYVQNYRYRALTDASGRLYRWEERVKQCILPFGECGTKMQTESGEIVYHNVLSFHEFAQKQRTPEAWEQDILITRKRAKFEIQVQCKVPTHLKSFWKGINSKDLDPTDNYEILANSSTGNDSLTISYFRLNTTSNTLQPITNFLIGGRIYVLVRLSLEYNKNVELKGQQLTLRNCYATASVDQQHEPLYYLLENGCVKDQTFRYEYDLLRKQNTSEFKNFDFKTLISFEAFRFKDDFSKVFIQAEADVCSKTSNCNSCNDADAPVRSKRNAEPELQKPYAGGSHFNTEIDEGVGVLGSIQWKDLQ